MADQNTRVNILPSCIFIPKIKNNFYYFLVIVIKYYLILLAKRKPHRSGGININQQHGRKHTLHQQFYEHAIDKM